MNSEGHLRLLGEGAGRSQQLELCTAQVLARALPVGESTARLLASKSGQSAILQVLDELARRRECASLDPDAVAAWVKVAQAANQARNRMIHGAWVTDGGTEVAAVLANGSMKIVPRSEWELQSDIDALATAVKAALQLL
jgi:hypothetical protein